MTEQDLKNMEMLLQRHADKFRKEVFPKIDQLLESIEKTCSHLQQQRVEAHRADTEAHHGV